MVARVLLLPEEGRARQGWRRCDESAVSWDLDSEEKRGVNWVPRKQAHFDAKMDMDMRVNERLTRERP